MTKISNSKQRFGHCILEFEYYLESSAWAEMRPLAHLEIVIWNFFKAYLN